MCASSPSYGVIGRTGAYLNLSELDSVRGYPRRQPLHWRRRIRMIRWRVNLLIRLIPELLVRFFARPYVAGDSLDSALEVSAEILQRNGFLTSLDLLAEGIDSSEVVEKNVQTYLKMVDRVAADCRFAGRRPSLSLKPSSYTTSSLDDGGDAEGAGEAIRRICEHAGKNEVQVTIDMESRHWTDFTLDCLDQLHADGQHHVGCVIQTRLHRSAEDLERLPRGIRVRLVIGIYREPQSVALTDKRQMKERMIEYARHLLKRGHYVEFATHDESYIRRFLRDVIAADDVAVDRFEVQMLYGVPRRKLSRELVGRGITVRLYLPFALGWKMAIAYLRRRLDEYPAMAWLVLKNFFRFG